MRIAPPLSVPARDAVVLCGWISDPAEPTLARRAQIVLLCRDGHGPSAVAEQTSCAKQTVIFWRERYRSEGLGGLRDAPRAGRPVTVDPDAVVLATLRPPAGTRWSTRSLGAELGISNVAVGNVWREWGIRPAAGGRVLLRTEPVLDGRVVDVLGLFVDPPVYVFAVAVDDGTAAVPASTAGLGLPADLLAAASGTGGSVALETFLDQLDHARDYRRLGATKTTALLASGATESVRSRTRGRAGITLHTVAVRSVWERLVRVGCLLAADASPDDAASVEALRMAVVGHSGGFFSWTRSGRD